MAHRSPRRRSPLCDHPSRGHRARLRLYPAASPNPVPGCQPGQKLTVVVRKSGHKSRGTFVFDDLGRMENFEIVASKDSFPRASTTKDPLEAEADRLKDLDLDRGHFAPAMAVDLPAVTEAWWNMFHQTRTSNRGPFREVDRAVAKARRDIKGARSAKIVLRGNVEWSPEAAFDVVRVEFSGTVRTRSRDGTMTERNLFKRPGGVLRLQNA